MSLPDVDTDVLVAGGGAAGLTVAARLALNGRSVTVASSATPATALSTGRVLLDHGDPEGQSGRRSSKRISARRLPVMSRLIAMTNQGQG